MKALCLPSYASVHQTALSSLRNHVQEKMPTGLDHRPILNKQGQRRPLGLCP